MVKKDDEKPQAPKRALSAFFLYRGEVYQDVKKANPNAKITEITRIISEMWGKVSAATKLRLGEEYEKNKVEAMKLKEDYEKQYGKIIRKKKKKHDKKARDDE